GTVAFVSAGGFPMPELFAVLAIAFEFGGALMLLTGYRARMGAKALIILTALATAAYHNMFSDPTQQIMMLKNLAIIGGLLYVSAFGAGAYSLHKKCGDCGSARCPVCNSDEKKEGTIQGDEV
ncbi:MAG: DoxX family protein, partial [Candidatus Kaiserbacteria bacterium]|nr:DoxX family protein [Candidatus Kaiserbacteria bacterium]